ncbi:PRKCA-binding protein isoform X2 [Sorex araneus]|uniref:PRKCA-binding protein isoform X2 n=1 Tax=Sorex araneus TaxID=42254 RepID=UPI002433D9E7|nr:PRKCA-binding protein isoform X2 [Sorex araneus]
MFADLDYDIEEDKLGIPTVPGKVTLQKDAQNLIGISIGGGAQYCPCLYIVQVFDNTPAALDGTVAAGDEITGVNGKSIKGKTKVEVAKMIQAVKGEVTIHYNKLQADPKQGMSLDIVLKKVKHRLVENMSSGTADALGLSRAILCNDGLVKRLEELERTAELYKGMTEHTKNLLRAFYELSQTHRAFGDVFSVIGVREPQPAASEAFVKFADAHRSIEKFGIRLLKTIKPMLTDLNTYLNKAIPDTRLTIKKYLDVKFEYLSYCLKVKEMDDEEYSCIALGEPLYRVSTGNYEYRLILRCRQEARARFSQMRKDVLEKMELLDQKHGHRVPAAALRVHHVQVLQRLLRGAAGRRRLPHRGGPGAHHAGLRPGPGGVHRRRGGRGGRGGHGLQGALPECARGRGAPGQGWELV